MRARLRLPFVVVLFLAVFCTAQAEEVKLQHKGLDLNANLALAEDKALSDGVLLMVHGTLAHGRMEIMSTLQELLQEAGISSLAINLSLGLSNRHGMYDCATPHTHRHEDAVAEIGAWLKWLDARGAGDVVLLGHSRGGNQATWYAAEHASPKLKGLVLIAPAARGPDEEPGRYQKRFKKPLAPVLADARSKVEAGKGDAMMTRVNFLYCEETSASAASFVSYHGEEPRMNTPELIPGIDIPVIVFVGSEDDVTRGLESKLASHVDDQKVRLTVIDGADHFFRDLYAEEVVEELEEWLEDVLR